MVDAVPNSALRMPYPPMNATSDGECRSLQLVDIIDLKWMLAGEGVRLHVERLQHDPAYARSLLECACRSPNEALRLAAQRMGRRLGLDGAAS
jgi:hypothetical protein